MSETHFAEIGLFFAIWGSIWLYLIGSCQTLFYGLSTLKCKHVSCQSSIFVGKIHTFKLHSRLRRSIESEQISLCSKRSELVSIVEIQKKSAQAKWFLLFQTAKSFLFEHWKRLVSYRKKQLSHLDQCQKPISEHNKRFITQFFASNEGH